MALGLFLVLVVTVGVLAGAIPIPISFALIASPMSQIADRAGLSVAETTTNPRKQP